MVLTQCMGNRKVCWKLCYIKLFTISHDYSQSLLHSVLTNVDGFAIVHQSPSEVKLDGKLATPLYCICSGHCLEYNYVWMVSGQHVGCNSPVLWVKTPGNGIHFVTHHTYHFSADLHSTDIPILCLWWVIVSILPFWWCLTCQVDPYTADCISGRYRLSLTATLVCQLFSLH